MVDADVLIIGAGAAGLAAAVRLEEAGLEVVIIEARERAGGRVLTLRRDDLDYPIELGAEFVHGHAPSAFALADESNVVLADVTENHWYQQNGEVVKSDEYWSDVETIMSHMTDMPFDMSFSDYLKQEYGDERWDKAKVVALSYVQGFNAANADKIGIKGLAIQESAEEELGETQFRIISGYDTIIDAMVRKLPRARILLQNVVKEIDWNSEGVRVSVIDRVEKRSYQLSCKSALVTLPLGVLKAPETSESHVRFTPPLDDKSKAMQSLEMGPVARNTFRFTNRFWESLKVPGGDEETDMMKLGFLHDNELPVPTWWTQMPVRVPLLVGWVAGASFERQFMNVESEEIAAQALKSLSMLLNIGRADLEKHLVESYTHNWQTDPFALGAYSYVGTNGLAAQKRLAEPVGNALFFAGEATNSDGNWGTVHGAIDSGVRAAKEILKVFHGN